jgi:UPF0755 protein
MQRNRLIYILAGTGIAAIIISIIIYRTLFGITVKTSKNNQVIFIPTGSTYEQVMDSLKTNLNIRNINVLEWFARKKHYAESVKPGRYIIKNGLTYNILINLLRSGRQSPVRITFNNVRTMNQIAGKIGRQIEADSSLIADFFNDASNYSKDGFKKEDIISVFIPNTYELYWSTSAGGLYDRMLNEYRLFWNDHRLSEAKEIGLDPKEVSIIASIIDDEVSKKDEKSRIAGVYLNRLRRGMPLQSCPTIKFALNDFSITRVLKKYLTVDSPYNTYQHTGLPPGPIGCASIEGIDAVLNAEKHDYLYFAAKSDFSGYHNFSRTLSEHNRYASLYQKELDRRKIFK